MRWKIFLTSLPLACLLFCSSCNNQDHRRDDEAAIKKKSESFVKAFNSQDSKILGTLWAEDAEYVNPKTGETLKGREEIEAAYRVSFEDSEKANLEIAIENISFPEENRAIETGTAIITKPGEEASRTAFKAYYEKRHGNWLLIAVREVENEAPPSNYEHLKELDWLVGHWIDEDEDSKIETLCEWDKYKNFLTQHFTVSMEGDQVLEGKQIIAWDAANEKIRSWVFDSDGGFGEGIWKKDGDQWVVETAFTLADGRRGSAINIYTPEGSDSYTWESTGREVGGEILPNIEPVKVKRV